MPTYDTDKVVAPAGSVMVNLPSRLVAAPTLWPTTRTVAPIMGSLSSCEVTVPWITVWAKAVLSEQSNMVNNKKSSFFIGVGVCKGEKMAGTQSLIRKIRMLLWLALTI